MQESKQTKKIYHYRLLGSLVLFCLAQFLILFVLPGPVYADSFPIIGTLHAGQRPEALAVDTQTHMLYVGYEAGLALGFNPVSGQVTWRTPLGNSVTDIQVDSTSHRVYATSTTYNNQQSSLYVLDGATGHILSTLHVGAGDNSIAFDTKRQRIYVSSKDDSMVYTFTPLPDGPNGTLNFQSTQLHIGSHATAVGVNSRLGHLYVADSTLSLVTVIDEDSGHILTTVSTAAFPVGPLRIDEASGRVYIVCSTGQELDVLDGKTNTITARIPVAPYPEGIAINTATGRIYVADEGNNESGPNNQSDGTTLTVIDGHTLDLLGTFQVGRSPDGVDADPILHRVYVAVEDTGTIVEMSDSVDVPLTPDATVHQAITARQTIAAIQQATMITVIAMLLTIIGATLVALLPHWRAREIPQTLPSAELSRSEQHSHLR